MVVKSYLCRFISWMPLRPYPSRSVGLSRHSFLMRLCALRVIFFGNSMTSMPFRIMLYVFIGSDPVKGGLKQSQVLGLVSAWQKKHCRLLWDSWVRLPGDFFDWPFESCFCFRVKVPSWSGSFVFQVISSSDGRCAVCLPSCKQQKRTLLRKCAFTRSHVVISFLLKVYTFLLAVQTSRFPGTSSRRHDRAPCSGWSQVPRTRVFHKTSTFSDQTRSSSQTQNPPVSMVHQNAMTSQLLMSSLGCSVPGNIAQGSCKSYWSACWVVIVFLPWWWAIIPNWTDQPAILHRTY